MNTAVESCSRLTLDTLRENIVGIDAQVPLLDGTHRTYVNFDNAASTPALRPVFDRVNDFMRWYSSVHRGSGFKSQLATQAFEDARHILYEFFNADPTTHTVIFGKNSTEALNKLAHRFPLSDGDVVLTTMMEHHSNDLPWRAAGHVEHIAIDRQGALDEAHLDHLLRRHAGRVKLVAVTGASNVTGYINPIYRIAQKAHAAGAQILVDAAQLAPHRAVDMRYGDEDSHIDYLVISAHKMYAPYGTGALIGQRETFLQGDPDMVGGGTVEVVTLDSVAWAGLPDREEAGSPNVVGAVALAQAVLSLQEVGMEAVAEHERQLTAYMLKRLAEVEGVQVYGITDPARAHEKVGAIPFNVEGMFHSLVAAILSAEGGIGVRNGCFCAHPYIMRLMNVSDEDIAAFRALILQHNKTQVPGLLRISFGCYNDEAEIDWFIEVLERIVRRDYTGRYVQDTASGDYWPEGFKPELAAYFSLR